MQTVGTEADICNQALGLVGLKQPITALTDNTVGAQMCAIYYAPARDAVLEKFPWRFATQRAQLALLNTTRSGWLYAYQLPADCIEPRYIDTGVRPGATYPISTAVAYEAAFGQILPALASPLPVPFTVEASDDGNSQILLTDQSAALLVYTARIVSPAAFPPGFVRALRYYLAADLAAVIPGKAALENQLRLRYQQELQEAGAASLRGTKDDPAPDAAYITVRGG